MEISVLALLLLVFVLALGLVGILVLALVHVLIFIAHDFCPPENFVCGFPLS
jgi:hypothetical protein